MPRTVWSIFGSNPLSILSRSRNTSTSTTLVRGIEAVVPDVRQDHRLRDDPAGVAHQVFEQRELARAELDSRPVARDAARHRSSVRSPTVRRVDVGGAGRAPDQRLHAGEQLGERERLRQVVVAAGLEPLDAVVDRVPRAQDQDRCPHAAGRASLRSALRPSSFGSIRSTIATSYGAARGQLERRSRRRRRDRRQSPPPAALSRRSRRSSGRLRR